VEDLIKRENEWGTDVVLLDTYSHAFSSRSDDGNAKAIEFARVVRHIMHQVGCSVVVVDHTGYTQTDEPRDASAKRQQVDVAIIMHKDGEWEGPGSDAKFTMSNKKSARFGNPFDRLSGKIVDMHGGGLDIEWRDSELNEWWTK
jgi:RecA-family ATPase